MSTIRGSGTTPEQRVRKALTSLALRYRLHVAKLPGKPDIVMASRKTIVLVHGCFWHRHTCAKGRSMPSTRVEFWEEKLRRNVERDSEQKRVLHNLGWMVITVWECETRSFEELRRRLSEELFG